MSETAQLILDGETYEFPIIEGTEQEKAIDISKLRAQTGYITLDYGFKNTGSTQSAITYLDGENGVFGTAVTPSKNWPKTLHLLKSHTC